MIKKKDLKKQYIITIWDQGFWDLYDHRPQMPSIFHNIKDHEDQNEKIHKIA